MLTFNVFASCPCAGILSPIFKFIVMYCFKSSSTFLTRVSVLQILSEILKFIDFTLQPVSFDFLALCSKIPSAQRYSKASLVVFGELSISLAIALEEGRFSPDLKLCFTISCLIFSDAISRFEVSFLISVFEFLSFIIVPMHCFD